MFFLPLALSFSPDVNTICDTKLEIDSTNSCWEKTDMNSIQSWSNITARFRFSIKYLKLKVVLQIVCLVPALLAPKLIFYISTNELLFTNFKDAAFSPNPLIRCCFAMMQCFENWGVLWQITRSQTIIRQSPYTKVSKALNRMTECNNNEISIKKFNCYDKVPKYCNPLACHCQDLIGNILCCLFWAINVMWINVEYVWVCQFSERVRRALISPKTGR